MGFVDSKEAGGFQATQCNQLKGYFMQFDISAEPLVLFAVGIVMLIFPRLVNRSGDDKKGFGYFIWLRISSLFLFWH